MTEGNKMFTKIVFITAVILTAFFIFTRLPAIGTGKRRTIPESRMWSAAELRMTTVT